MRITRPIEPKDVVRITTNAHYKDTGVVHRVNGSRVSVFVTNNNPFGIAIWFNIADLKRIGRVK